jgi:replicative DNA helicase
LVIFLYRAEYYGLEVDEQNNPTRGVGELIVAKHRNGALRNVFVRFIDKFAKFVDADMGMGGTRDRQLPPPDSNIQTLKSRKWDEAERDEDDGAAPF